MRKVLLLGAGVAALGIGVAVAQQPPPPPPPGPSGEMGTPPQDGQGRDRGDRAWRMRRYGGDLRMTGPGAGAGSARFHFKRGDAELDIRCPANEPVRACVDAAAALLDKLPR